MYTKLYYEQLEPGKLEPSAELEVKPLPRLHGGAAAEVAGAAEDATRVAANVDLQDDFHGVAEVEAEGVEEAVATDKVVVTTEPVTSSPRQP